MKLSVIIGLLSITASSAWAPVSTLSRSSKTALPMAIDYNNPVVAEEFANVQPMSYEEVEAELQESGVRPSAAMNEMEVKLMLVEMRLRLSGRLEGDEPKKRPTTFSSKLEECLWTKPAF